MKSTTKLLDSTLSDNSVYIYDMMGNLQTKTGTGTAVTFGYDENGSLVSLRTDIMLDGRKELERRTSFAGSGSSVTEYSMLYGSGSVLGRRLADGTSEWYVKDRQGSLVMSVVNNGLGTALVYEPFGFQRLLYASGNEPAEQYTGKEYDGRLGLTYFGARYFDPSFALWLTPDPARQYLNPYSYGGDPVNGVDRDGRFWEKFKNVLTLGALEILSGGMLSTGAGAVAGTAVGLGVGAASLGVGAAVGADALTGGLLGGLLGGMAGIVVATPGGTSLLTSLYANDWEWDSDVANSFLTGVFVDLSGGVIPAAGNMTMMSYAQRCYNDFDNCGFLASDFATGGYFMDNIGHTIGLANAQYFGGTADWYSYGGVSDYYDGNVVYSGGLFGGPLKDAKNGEDFGFAHFGHAVFVSDKNRKDMIAHELTHVRQQERRGFRIGYLVSYLYENDWWIDSDADGYRANPYEMEAYYFQFLYDQGYINMDGSLKDGVVEDHDEWSRIFYEKGYTDSRGDWHQAYRDWKGVEARYEKHWTWEGDWSFYETP